ncbi:MAG: LETM1-related biofilm-associated protein [Flavobacterium sp.]|nr:LETM1-related biofilm-associated protein [Flavobacterium sp.]
MINPSAQGWIDKFLSKYYLPRVLSATDDRLFYYKLRKTGFIYGHVVFLETKHELSFKGWTSEEISKVVLFDSLFGIYEIVTKDSDSNAFIQTLLQFYDVLHPENFSFIRKILPNEVNSIRLEKIINERVQTNDNIINKNFSHLVTNALLFVDVLAFQNYLIHGGLSKNYIQKIEEIIISIVSLALKNKITKTQYDDLLIRLFESSVRYTKFSNCKIDNLNKLDFKFIQRDLEKFYIMDLVGMSLWNDEILDEKEIIILNAIGRLFDLKPEFVKESYVEIDSFIRENKKNIPYFNYSNPIKHFYDQATQNVILLITRNKRRLQKELSESKELVILLAASTHRELDSMEKKRMKKQLLDVCKTIPSLTIFLLPGGSILLPLLIKFIPQLLPSTFNENLDN